MDTKQSSAFDSQRTTVALTGTVTKTQAGLDERSAIALAYATEWHRRAGGLKVPSSGLIRRALQLYCVHLQQAGKGEVHAVHSACNAFTPADADEARRMALLRLYGADEAQPLPSFAVVIDGPRVVAERAAEHARLERVLEALQ